MRISLVVAALCALAALAWQALVVHYDYGGNWTSLYCTGGRFAQPPLAERIWTFPDSYGYDGQWYHYIAHDPWLRRGFDRFFDAPRVRYHRILLPALAYLLAGGRDRYVDRVYLGLVLLSIAFGSFWMSRYASLHEGSPWLGLGFLLVPSVLVSVDRLTVDGVLAALCAGFVWFVETDAEWPLYTLLLAAPLVRDTGFLLLGGYVGAMLVARHIRRAAVFSTAALPTIGWYWFVAQHTAHDHTQWFSELPLAGYFHQLVHPNSYPLAWPALVTARVLDYIALAGAALAIGWSLMLLRKKTGTPSVIAIYGFVALAAVFRLEDFWSDAYGFGRILAPLFLLLALEGICERRWAMALPMLMVTPRIAAQLAALGLRVVKAMLG